MDEKERDWERRTSCTIISTISTGRNFVEELCTIRVYEARLSEIKCLTVFLVGDAI